MEDIPTVPLDTARSLTCPETIQLIQHIRTSPPSRLVEEGIGICFSEAATIPPKPNDRQRHFGRFQEILRGNRESIGEFLTC